MGCEQSVSGNAPRRAEITQTVIRFQIPQELRKIPPNKNIIKTLPNEEQYLEWFWQLKRSCNKSNLSNVEKVAYELFIHNYVKESIELNQRIIQIDPLYGNDFEGLGNRLMSSGRYQWNIPDWYKRQLEDKKIKQSHYDLLSLSYLMFQAHDRTYMNEMKQGLLWYQQMANRSSQNIAIFMGCAHLCQCLDFLDESLKWYDRVIQVDPSFVNAYVSKAMIYQYMKEDLKQASQLATKINTTFGSNCYAQFILARNLTDVNKKIQALKIASQKHPYYVRIVNQIGLCYGGLGKQDQAIQWYKKCLDLEPQYYFAYLNIGRKYFAKKNYEEARRWAYKAIAVDEQLDGAYQNLVDIFTELKYTNEKILEQVGKQNDIKLGLFSCQLGAAYREKKNFSQAYRWQQRSIELQPQNYKFWFKLALTYDYSQNLFQAQWKYRKTIQLNPEYESAYNNLGLVYKKLGRMDKCEECYRKAVEINPKHSSSWNNLGNIYKGRQQYEQAIEYYEFAIQYNSSYTLAMANMGVCLLKLEKYKEAFGVFERAKITMANGQNSLSQSNRNFLKLNLDRFELQGKKWKQSGSVTNEEKQSLKKLIEQFETKFKNIATATKTVEMPTQKIFQPQIISILKILKEDKFELRLIEQIFDLVAKVFHQDEDYFHIIPLLVIENFTTKVFAKGLEMHQVEKELKNIMEKIAKIVEKLQIEANKMNLEPVKVPEITLNQSQITNSKVNLFTQALYFSSAQQLYVEINRVNVLARKSYTDFSLLVQEARKKSGGIAGGISTKIPLKQSQQFKVMLRIMQKLFKKEIDHPRRQKIALQINTQLKKLKNPTLQLVVREVTTAWNNQITSILKQRFQKNKQTHFSISDLLRARCLYTSTGDLIKAVHVVDHYCKAMGYEVVELDNRLAKRQTQDVVFKIRIRHAVCQLQLAMKQDEKLTHLDHCVYEILRSPLGVIFGSYLFMSKQVKYPFTTNCKDIIDKANEKVTKDVDLIKEYAHYVLTELQKTQNNLINEKDAPPK